MSSPAFYEQLQDQLDRRASEHARRFFVEYQPEADGGGKYVRTTDGQRMLNLASNDYLALAHDPRIAQAIQSVAQTAGSGAGASRLVTGTHPEHTACERAFTEAKHPVADGETDNPYASVLVPSGYSANLAVLSTLANAQDLVVIDKLVHASLIDAARASGATVRSYPHLNTQRLQQLLAEHGPNARRRFIVTDSVFSMDGDCADLPALCDLADQHDAVLIVDEAHGTGVLGDTGTGVAEADGVLDRIDVSIATCSKALGGQGGVITAKRAVVDTLINEARSLLYTTGVMPPLAAAARCALAIARDDTARREHLASLSVWMREQLAARGWGLPPTRWPTPILPLITGSNEAALALAQHLKKHGFLGVAIRPPTVAPNAARIRLTLRADLTQEDLESLLHTLDAWQNQPTKQP